MKTEEVCTHETIQFGTDASGVTRRSFMGGMGAMMAGAALAAAGSKSAFADESEEAAAEEESDEEEETAEVEAEETEEAEEAAETEDTTISITSVTGWTGTPEDLLALGISTMPLDDLNQYRQAYLDTQTEYTMEDGTVVPVLYSKARALINTYGSGCGNTPIDDSFQEMLEVFSEDDCQAFIDMPWGQEFTAYEMAEKEGRDVEECEEICERLATAGYMCRYDTNRGRVYHQVPYFQGITEYHFGTYVENDGDYVSPAKGSDFATGTDSCMATTGTPTFYYVPVDASATSTGTILPLDDVKEKVKQANVVSLTPCPCRYEALVAAYGKDNIPSFEDFATGEYEDYFSDLCDQRVETCISTGDEAQYWIDQGWGRQITGEQAAEYIQRDVDDGFMIESTFGKNSDTICSCHVDSCGVIATWMMIGTGEEVAACDAFKQVSHYTLEVDSSLCIACGTCVDRCPMHIISINDEGWAESGDPCFRCGQCAYVCPQGARKLVERDESELAPLPQGMVEDANVKAAYRFEKGLIY